MPALQNFRTKTPRPVAITRSASAAHLWSSPSLTPTPPPVAMDTEFDFEEEAAGQPPMRRHPAWIWVVSIVVGMVGTASAWRSDEAKSWAITKIEALNATAAATLAAMPKLKSKKSAEKTAASPTPAKQAATPENDWTVKHEGHVPIRGGILVTPSTFKPTDSNYDLIVHFHGDVNIVKESVERAGLNAALAIINVGIGSGSYRKQYNQPASFDKLIAQISRGLESRGLKKPKLRRLALTSWSAGYGSIGTILDIRSHQKPARDPLDAILVFDGIHADYWDEQRRSVNMLSIRPFIRAARAATRDQLMFVQTHSDIDPVTYVSTSNSAKIIMDALNIKATKSPVMETPALIDLASSRKVGNGPPKKMQPHTDVTRGSLRIRGFKGITKAAHASHLIQMASLGLQDLARRWSKPPESTESQDTDTDEVDTDQEPTTASDADSGKDADATAADAPTKGRQFAKGDDAVAKAATMPEIETNHGSPPPSTDPNDAATDAPKRAPTKGARPQEPAEVPINISGP